MPPAKTLPPARGTMLKSAPSALLSAEMPLVCIVTSSTSGISAESNADGPLFNMVPRAGGNVFAGGMSGYYSGSGLQSDNLTDTLRSRQLTTVNKVLSVYDATVTLGGPIKRDTVWFFGSVREWGNAKSDAGLW